MNRFLRTYVRLLSVGALVMLAACQTAPRSTATSTPAASSAPSPMTTPAPATQSPAPVQPQASAAPRPMPAPAATPVPAPAPSTRPAPAPAAGSPAPARPQASAQPQAAAVPAAAAEPIQFYLAQPQPGKDLTSLKLKDGTIYVQAQQAVLTRADLSQAMPMTDNQGHYFLGMRFTDEGARKLNEISTRNVGKLLVVVVGQELVGVPRITEPLNRGMMAFPVPSAQDADRILARIRGQ